MRLSKRMVALSTAWIIISLLIALEMKLMSYHNPEEGYDDSTILIYFIIEIVAGLLLVRCIVIPIYDYGKNMTTKFSKIIVGIINGLVFSIAFTLVFALIFEINNNGTLTKEYFSRVQNLFFMDFHNTVKTFLIFLTILYAFDFMDRNLKALLQKKNLQNQLNNFKLESLKAQLQPHFLFNALNNVVALIEEDSKKAQSVLIYIGDLLRYSIDLNPKTLIPLREEIENSKRFIAIEKAKFEDQIHINWDLEDSFLNQLVPALIIQPIIENAIKHGFEENTRKLLISICVSQNRIEIKNNGAKYQPGYFGQGINLVKERLKLHFGHKASFQIYQEEDWVINEIVFHGGS